MAENEFEEADLAKLIPFRWSTRERRQTKRLIDSKPLALEPDSIARREDAGRGSRGQARRTGLPHPSRALAGKFGHRTS